MMKPHVHVTTGVLEFSAPNRKAYLPTWVRDISCSLSPVVCCSIAAALIVRVFWSADVLVVRVVLSDDAKPESGG